MKQKCEPKTVGPMKDEEFVPWNGVTLNRCLAIAAVAALLSVGFQVLQESVDSDDLAEAENDIWTSPESNDQQQSDAWFFEGWFGSSTQNLPDIEEPEIPEPLEEDISTSEELQEIVTEEPEPEVTEEETKTEAESSIEEPLEANTKENKQEKQKASNQWGLKPKGRYMEAKALKIRRADGDGSQRKAVFPFNFAKKHQDSPKPEKKEKPYKDVTYQKKYNEKKNDYPKKHEHEKSFKKEREEHNKYFKQEKGKKEDKEYKGYKQYHSDKDYKKKYDSRHHG